MAKKKSKKIKMVESHEAQTIGFLQRSGVPAKDIKKLIHEIHELIEFGGVSIPEAHQEVLENWHQRTALAGLRELEAELKKQTADVAKAQKRAIASAKATTKANEAAARLAAKAEAKAAKTAAVTVPPDTTPIPPVAEPAGPTVMPRPSSPYSPRPESGIRKALGKSLTKEEQEYQKTLDKLRSDAANTVQENPDLFGSGRYDQTIDQSTLYQLYEGVVELGESAAKARKAEDKQRLLASLNAYKKIVMGLAKEGSDKEKELANKLLEIIASIEKKLSKGAGEIGRLKENLKDWAQKIPENLAAKIPLVGGFISGMLQRKRERKEGEEYQKQDILAASSRGIGGSSLFGRVGGGGGRGGMGGMSESAVEAISTGGSDLGDIEAAETGSPVPSGSLGGGETIRTLQSILVQVADIKSLIQGQTDSEAGLDAEETARETADKEYDILNKLKGLFGGGKGGKAGATVEVTGGLGWKELIGSLIGKEILAAALAPVLSVLSSMLGTLVSWPVIGGALVVTFAGGGVVAIIKAIIDATTGLKMYLDQYINKATGKTDPNPRGFMGAPRIPQTDIDATQSMTPDGMYTGGSLPTNATSISESIDKEQLLKMMDEEAAASPESSPDFVGPPSPSTPAASTGAATPAAMIAGAVMGAVASNSDDIDPDTDIGNIIPPTPAKKEYKNPVELMEGWKNPIELTPEDLEEHARLSEERKKVWKNPKFSTSEEKAQLAAADEKLNNSKFSLSSAAENIELEKRMEDQNSKNNEIDSQKRLSETTSKGTIEPTTTSEKSAINNIAGEEVIPGKDLSEKQMTAIKLGLLQPNGGTKYPESIISQYQKQGGNVAAATGVVGSIIKNEKYNDEDWVAATGADGKPIEGSFINKKTKQMNALVYGQLDDYNNGIINKAGDTTEKGRQIGIAKMQSEGWSESEIAEAYPSPATGTISTPSTLNTEVGAATAQLDKSREGLELEDKQSSAREASSNSNTVIAPKTNNTTINNNSGGSGTRNNDPTVKAVERGSM